jgi:hypothetical protein
LFLDTELTDRDCEFIAKKVLKSGYTPSEIKTILWFEVFPVLESNLLDPAGVWAGFPRDWLLENMRVFIHTPQTIQDTDTVIDIKNCWQKVCKFLPNEYA